MDRQLDHSPQYWLRRLADTAGPVAPVFELDTINFRF